MKRPPLVTRNFISPEHSKHTVGIAANGQIFLTGHPRETLAREQHHREIGGKSCGCLAALEYLAGRTKRVHSGITTTFRPFTPHSCQAIRRSPDKMMAWRLQRKLMARRDATSWDIPDLGPLAIRPWGDGRHPAEGRSADAEKSAKKVLSACAWVLRIWGWPVHCHTQRFHFSAWPWRPGAPITVHHLLTVDADPDLLARIDKKKHYQYYYRPDVTPLDGRSLWVEKELVIALSARHGGWRRGVTYDCWGWSSFHVHESVPIPLRLLACHMERALLYNLFVEPAAHRNTRKNRPTYRQRKRQHYLEAMKV